MNQYARPCAGDGSFKFLPYQLSTAGSWPAMVYALIAFHSSYHSLISRPGVRSLRHSWSLRSLTDYPSSYPPFILHFIAKRCKANIKKPGNIIKGPKDSIGSVEPTAPDTRANILAASAPQIRLQNPVHYYTDKVTRLKNITETTV